MGELARVLINRGQSMNIAIFSTRDLQEQCRKSYVASYQANQGIGDLVNVFSRTTSIKGIRERFLP